MKFLFLFLLPLLLVGSLEAAARSQLEQFNFPSKIMNNTREVWVYTPPHYSKNAGPLPMLVVFDGQAYVSSLVPTPSMLDQLIYQGKIRPVLAVFVRSIEPERDNELPCNEAFTRFLTDELLPWVYARYNVSKDPGLVGVCGSSYGGLAAVYTVWKRPDIFGMALSQSGSFSYGSAGSPPEQALMHLVKAKPIKGAVIYMNVGLQETNEYDGRISTLNANRVMRDILVENNNTVYYQEYPGGHEYEWWSRTLPEGLIALFPRN